MFKNVDCNFTNSGLAIVIDTCSQSIIDCVKKQENAGRIRVLKKSKPYKVGKDLYTTIKYIRNK